MQWLKRKCKNTMVCPFLTVFFAFIPMMHASRRTVLVFAVWLVFISSPLLKIYENSSEICERAGTAKRLK